MPSAPVTGCLSMERQGIQSTSLCLSVVTPPSTSMMRSGMVSMWSSAVPTYHVLPTPGSPYTRRFSHSTISDGCLTCSDSRSSDDLSSEIVAIISFLYVCQYHGDVGRGHDHTVCGNNVSIRGGHPRSLRKSVDFVYQCKDNVKLTQRLTAHTIVTRCATAS